MGWLEFYLLIVLLPIYTLILYLVINPFGHSDLLKGFSERHYANWKMEKEFDNKTSKEELK